LSWDSASGGEGFHRFQGTASTECLAYGLPCSPLDAFAATRCYGRQTEEPSSSYLEWNVLAGSSITTIDFSLLMTIPRFLVATVRACQ